MTVKTTIEAELKAAILSKNEMRKGTLRMVKADLLNQEVKLGRDLTDEESFSVIEKGVKSRKDSIEQYVAAGRGESAASEQAEIDIMLEFIPKKLSAEETTTAIEALMIELEVKDKKDLGRLMKELKTRYPTLDSKLAAGIVNQKLA